jgi:ribosome-binding protein aMBF1 (putative translation factor)
MLSVATWSDVRSRRSDEPGVAEGYERARRAYELGCEVKALREHAGMSQSELARQSGTSQAAIARLESGGTEPRLSTLDRVGEVLGVTHVVRFDAADAPHPAAAAHS